MKNKDNKKFWGSILVTVSQAVAGSLTGMDKTKRNYVIGVIIVAVCLGIGTALLTGCGAEFVHTAIEGDDGCEPEAVVCENNIWAVCNADKSWNILRCSDYEPGLWTCCEFRGKLGCHKEEDCL